MIDLTNLPYGITDRTTTEGRNELYETLDLYSYSTEGTEYNESDPQADASKPLGKTVLRVRKNCPISSSFDNITPQTLVFSFASRKFIVSPTDVYNDGGIESEPSSYILQDTEGNPKANKITMTWAEANGRLNTANAQGWDIESKAMNTGCYAYQGKNGKDTPGSWRTPNSRELSMILVFAHELDKYESTIGFQPLYKENAQTYHSGGYWSSTEQYNTQSWVNEATSGVIDINYGVTIYGRSNKENNKKSNRLRCIKDIP